MDLRSIGLTVAYRFYQNRLLVDHSAIGSLKSGAAEKVGATHRSTRRLVTTCILTVRCADNVCPHRVVCRQLVSSMYGVVFDADRHCTKWGEGGGVLIVMHGRSRTTIDPRIPAMPGRSTSGFHRPCRHCLHEARSKRREMFGKSQEW